MQEWWQNILYYCQTTGVVLVWTIAGMWVLEVINVLFRHKLCVLGIVPRDSKHLLCVITSPFIHGSFGHVAVNTVPLCALGFFVSLYGLADFIGISAAIAVIGGVLVWCCGRKAYHVGCSGLIFGYFGFLVTRGLLGDDMRALLIAVITIFAYGGMLWGVVPGIRKHMSWEGHLFGLLAGGLVGWLLVL